MCLIKREAFDGATQYGVTNGSALKYGIVVWVFGKQLRIFINIFKEIRII